MRREDTTYTRDEHGSFVPDGDPNSRASRLERSSIYLNYEIRDWSVVATMAGTPDKAPERERFDLHEAHPPRTEIRMVLKNDCRRLHSIRVEGSGDIPGDFNFRINGNENGATEGFIRHTPAWEAKHSSDSAPEAIHGGISVPRDQFEWLITELARPNARLHLRLIAPLYKEAIALSFDEPWMSQDIYVPYEELVHLRGFDFSVVHGPQMPPPLEVPLHEYEDVTLSDPAPQAPDPTPAPQPHDPRLTWIIYLLVALIVAVIIRWN